MINHGVHCPKSGQWYVKRACREFSTDGTALGADIAHTMGTMDEQGIINSHFDERGQELTGMDEEQADWDAEN